MSEVSVCLGLEAGLACSWRKRALWSQPSWTVVHTALSCHPIRGHTSNSTSIRSHYKGHNSFSPDYPALEFLPLPIWTLKQIYQYHLLFLIESILLWQFLLFTSSEGARIQEMDRYDSLNWCCTEMSLGWQCLVHGSCGMLIPCRNIMCVPTCPLPNIHMSSAPFLCAHLRLLPEGCLLWPGIRCGPRLTTGLQKKYPSFYT